MIEPKKLKRAAAFLGLQLAMCVLYGVIGYGLGQMAGYSDAVSVLVFDGKRGP